jgi:hypothetical protein
MLALTSRISGGRSVGIVRSRTKSTEFSLVLDNEASDSIKGEECIDQQKDYHTIFENGYEIEEI